jgi:hypothetical protein
MTVARYRSQPTMSFTPLAASVLSDRATMPRGVESCRDVISSKMMNGALKKVATVAIKSVAPSASDGQQISCNDFDG